MSWKNGLTSIVRRTLWELGLYDRIAVKKLLLRKQNGIKRLQWVKTHKDWTKEQWNKVLCTDKSKFKAFGSNSRVYVRRRVGERAATPSITPAVKHWVGSVMVRVTFVKWKVGDLHQVKEKLNQTGYHSIMQYHAISSGTRFVGQVFVLMKYNDLKHTSKLRDTLKTKRTVRPSTDVLADAISGLKSHWTDVGWTWPKSPIQTTHECGLPWRKGCPRGVMVKAMNCGIVVREFVLQSRYYVHFRANTLGKGMNPLILPPAMGK